MIDLTRRSFTEAASTGVTRWGIDRSDERRLSQLQDLITTRGEAEADDAARLIFWMQRNGVTTTGMDGLAAEAENEADAYEGEHDSPADFAEYLMTEAYGNLPDWAERYIDWAAVWERELAYDYDGHYTTDGKFHVWREI